MTTGIHGWGGEQICQDCRQRPRGVAIRLHHRGPYQGLPTMVKAAQ